jgi:hypothetical protein
VPPCREGVAIDPLIAPGRQSDPIDPQTGPAMPAGGGIPLTSLGGEAPVPVIDGLLVVAMVCLSGGAALRLPADARVPVHFGRWAPHTAIPKTPGLVLWVAIGVVTYLAAGVLGHPRTAEIAERLGLTLALATILVTQAVAVGLAAVHSRRT